MGELVYVGKKREGATKFQGFRELEEPASSCKPDLNGQTKATSAVWNSGNHQSSKNSLGLSFAGTRSLGTPMGGRSRARHSMLSLNKYENSTSGHCSKGA
eukprot:CAMPEP_0206497860 /NCGR_PEP_ID=MMETSP0324_2-20121206/50536_1 /ASSEMBLY_ACC=CAM_ASM_000836 /TAXON_ID=2866 /ORGANISM="Crypthecodinium cohnii, Strain Seligo" /LENGTH=99 /DNA_ID=CAMNT_0053983709 /DNA_START=261 /DNA_END=561 /DNA_ORIENTATION=+